MKKTKTKLQERKLSPHEAMVFLETIRTLSDDKDELTKLISLRVPENILRAVKLKAKAHQQKYQSLMIQYIREGLKK